MFLTVCCNPSIQKTIVLNSILQGRVNRSHKHSLDISGKGINVSRVLVQLQERVIHLTHSGGNFARFFSNRARTEHIRLFTVRAPVEIRFCITLLERDEGSTTEIIEDGYTVPSIVEEKMRKTFFRLLTKCRAVIISGSKADGYSAALFPDFVRLAKAAKKFVLTDFRGEDLTNSIPHRPDVIKPNLSEFIETFFPEYDPAKRDETLLAKVEDKMRSLANEYGIVSVVTDGAKPVRYMEGSKLRLFSPAPIHPFNTTGCGDAFTAGFASVYMKTKDVGESVRFACDCAARNALLLRPGVIHEEEAK